MKPYKFQLGQKAEAYFEKLSKNLQQRIWKKLVYFEQQKSPLSLAKRLQNYEEKWYRFRIGDYRIIVTPKDTKTLIILVIIKIGHRKGIYE